MFSLEHLKLTELRSRWIHEYSPLSHSLGSLLALCPLPVLLVSIQGPSPSRMGDTVPILELHSPLGSLPKKRQDRLLVVPVVFSSRACVIGRSEAANACLPFDTVSRLHAIVHHREDGRYEITDTRSRNGTYVDGKKLEPEMPHRLGADSHLKFGDLEAEFLVPEEFFRILALRRAEGAGQGTSSEGA